jgi:hypothetical protein
MRVWTILSLLAVAASAGYAQEQAQETPKETPKPPVQLEAKKIALYP